MLFYKKLRLYIMEGQYFCKDFSFHYYNAIIHFSCIAIVNLFLAKIYLIYNFLFNPYNPTHEFILSFTSLTRTLVFPPMHATILHELSQHNHYHVFHPPTHN